MVEISCLPDGSQKHSWNVFDQITIWNVRNKTPAWRILRIIVISEFLFLCFLRPSSTHAHLGVHKAKTQEKLLKLQQQNDFYNVLDVGSVFNISISHSTSPHSSCKVTFIMDFLHQKPVYFFYFANKEASGCPLGFLLSETNEIFCIFGLIMCYFDIFLKCCFLPWHKSFLSSRPGQKLRA